ncbi:S1 RNA-binding domain-containing protein [Candidatus Micrarchaeota archaeon]|nr:S1 RNA-binding domain-containing protein [Candidatus Micrarchaeota archaeon]
MWRSSGDWIELPDKDELIIAVVKKIMPYGAFCNLPEYGNMEAFLHISEIAPRWIKNIHEFISEGQRHVVKVVHVDTEKNQVDVSIKRVNDEEKKRKLELVQNEKRGAKLLELSLSTAKVKLTPEKARQEIESQYEDVFSCFKAASLEGEPALKKLDLPKMLKAKIAEIAKKNIKKPVVEVDTTASLVCFGENGVEDIKKVLSAGRDVTINYLGAPNYKISLTASDYKTGEKKLQKALEEIKALAQKNNCEFSYESR